MGICSGSSKRSESSSTSTSTSTPGSSSSPSSGSTSPGSNSESASKSSVSKHTHIVVVMMENRSLDNLLGYLYEEDKKKNFNGVSGKEKTLYCPVPDWAIDPANKDKTAVYVGKAKDVFSAPSHDPGEEYPHTNTQFFSTLDPKNLGLEALEMHAPYNSPEIGKDGKTPTPNMQGFVTDYASKWTKQKFGYDQYQEIMHCLTPEQVPVISTLAKSFAVCDNYFCEVPSQTFCNRSMFFTGQCSGRVINGATRSGFEAWSTGNTSKTFLNQLSEHSVDWKVYFDSLDPVPMTYLLHAEPLKHEHTKFHHLEDFFIDVERGDLPRFTFIEPRGWSNQEDYHPSDDQENPKGHSRVHSGEYLLHRIYSAIRNSKSEKGNNWSNTLLIINFDEGGGTYDHVPPPSTVNPHSEDTKLECNFKFDRLGIRVPCIFVSPYVEPGTVINKQLQHCSLTNFIRSHFGIHNEFLTKRDTSAPSLPVDEIFTRTTPRLQAALPETKYVEFKQTLDEKWDRFVISLRTHHMLANLDDFLTAKFGKDRLEEREDIFTDFLKAFGSIQDFLHGKPLFPKLRKRGEKDDEKDKDKE